MNCRRISETLHYQTGFANEFAAEALPRALPDGRTRRSARFAACGRTPVGHCVHRAATDQGSRDMKNTVKRSRAAREAFAAMGVDVREWFFTLGP